MTRKDTSKKEKITRKNIMNAVKLKISLKKIVEIRIDW